jgi:O-antigen/teichoic acid export membrane protein
MNYNILFKNKIFTNASWIIVCKVGQSILSLIVTMMTARYLGPSNFGLINYAASIVAFVAPIVKLGLGNIQVQELVDKPDEEGKIIGTSILMSVFSAVLGILGVFAFTIVANNGERDTVIVCLLYSLILFFQGAELIQYWFQAKYLSKYASIVSLIAFAIVSAYKVFLLVTKKGVIWFAISNPIDYFLILSVLLFIYNKLSNHQLEFSFEVAKRMISKSKYYIIANLMIVVFTQTDRIMLKIMLDSSATGFYSAAATSAQMINFVFLAIVDSMRPSIFEKHKKNKSQFNDSIKILYSIIIYSTLAYCLFIVVFAKPIIYIIYGDQYEVAIIVLQVIVWFIPFSFIGTIRNIWLLAESKQKWIPFINLSGALANVILNIVLIPFWGIMGAALASLITQFFSNILISYIIKDTRQGTILMFLGLNPNLVLNKFRNLLK